MKSVLIFVKNSQGARQTALELKRFLEERGFTSSMVLSTSKKRSFSRGYRLMIVVGGDGTFLAGARVASRLGIPVVGINEGRFGFLTEIERDEAPTALGDILDGRAKPQRRLMISAYLKRGSRIRFLGDYLNDVVITKSEIARIMEVRVFVNGSFTVHIHGDGAIVSTPTGSTAYALSSGGPIIYPESRSLLLVPVCPHTLSNRPLVLPPDSKIVLKPLIKNRNSYLTMDGQEGMYLEEGDRVIVTASKRRCLIYTHPSKDFFEILRGKLGWG